MSVSRVRPVLAIASREVRSAFVGPTGWIVLALAGLVAAASFFGSTFDDGQPATLRTVMLAAGWALLATAPAISMRSLSEEFRLKTWETLFAGPVGTAQIVAGKAIAAAILVAATLVPVALLALPLEMYASPDYGEIACGLLGLFLAGFTAACLGIAVSSTTSSQAVAFLGAFFAWLALVAGARILVGVLPIDLAPIAAALDPLRRLEGFTLGLFDSAAVVYFVAISAVALSFAVVSLERVRDRTGPTRLSRAFAGVEGAAFVTATALAAAAVVGLASQPALRVELDATKTRAYSLAPSTVSLLEGLDGDWKILLFVDARESDPAVLRQIDEVLERFREANPRLDARRIDPADPDGAGASRRRCRRSSRCARATWRAPRRPCDAGSRPSMCCAPRARGSPRACAPRRSSFPPTAPCAVRSSRWRACSRSSRPKASSSDRASSSFRARAPRGRFPTLRGRAARLRRAFAPGATKSRRPPRSSRSGGSRRRCRHRCAACSVRA